MHMTTCACTRPHENCATMCCDGVQDGDAGASNAKWWNPLTWPPRQPPPSENNINDLVDRGGATAQAGSGTNGWGDNHNDDNDAVGVKDARHGSTTNVRLERQLCIMLRSRQCCMLQGLLISSSIPPLKLACSTVCTACLPVHLACIYG